jgi:Lon-like ATP-dependent protease
MMKCGQPFLGALLLKNENTDSDVITDVNTVHRVGVFVEITVYFTLTHGFQVDSTWTP